MYTKLFQTLNLTLSCIINMPTPITGEQMVLYYTVIYYFIIIF